MNGGTPGFTYEWSNGADSAINNNLSAGSYVITVTDAYNCKVTEEFIINQPDQLQSINSVYDVKCFGNNDGSINVNVSGGTPDYTYYWEHTSENTNILNNLTAGTYYLTISDANLCSVYDTFLISQPNELIINSEKHDITCMEKQDGQIAISVQGGIQPYSYLWNTGNTNDTVLYQLGEGNYSVSIKDANNCEVQEAFTIYGTDESCLKIPSVFTPNNDNYNDKCEIKGAELFDNIDIKVFNRWGDIVFEFNGKGTEYNDPANQWNGTFKNSGKIINLTTFVYIIYLSGKEEPYNGTVTIVK
jgi:gliding motility-associated-like protein